MGYILGFALLVGGFYVLARIFVSVNAASLARNLKLFGAAVLGIVALALAAAGKWVWGAPLAFAAFSIARSHFLSGGGFSIPQRKRAGDRSTVRSDYFDMELDHDTGQMNGRIKKGRYTGQFLGDLTEPQCLTLYEELHREGADNDSLALLETYLDRTFPSWRESNDADIGSGQSNASGTGPITEEEAYEILGLSRTASVDEIRTAHRRLIRSLHPDVGGSAFLAAKVNEAKDLLLAKHSSSS